MSIGASTLTPSDEVKFLNKYSAMDPGQRDCLDKLLGAVTRDAFENCDTKDCVEDKIAKWIKRNVLNAKNPNYCEFVVNELASVVKDVPVGKKKKSK